MKKAILAASLVLLLTAVMSRPASTPTSSRKPTIVVRFVDQAASAHPIFMYSMVPGGVWTPREAGLPNGHLEILQHDMLGYVNYRRDGKVFWTRHLVLIRAGEQVIMDGDVVVRARCGNQIVRTKHLPVENYDASALLDLHQPAVVAPEVPQNLANSTIPDFPTASLPPTVDLQNPLDPSVPLPTVSADLPVGYPAPSFTPFSFPPAEGPSVPSQTPTHQPVSVPEPSQIIFVGMALAMLLTLVVGKNKMGISR